MCLIKSTLQPTFYTPPRYIWRWANPWSFLKWNPVLEFDRRPFSEQQQVTALRQQHTSGSGDQATKGPCAVGYLRIICAVPREHMTLFSLALGRLGFSVVCVGFDSVVVLAVVYLR